MNWASHLSFYLPDGLANKFIICPLLINYIWGKWEIVFSSWILRNNSQDIMNTHIGTWSGCLWLLSHFWTLYSHRPATVVCYWHFVGHPVCCDPPPHCSVNSTPFLATTAFLIPTEGLTKTKVLYGKEVTFVSTHSVILLPAEYCAFFCHSKMLPVWYFSLFICKYM